MDKWHILEKLLRENKPFSFIKINDGESNLILKNKVAVSRGFQDYNEEISNNLYNALTYNASNYYIGLPCTYCYGNMIESLKSYININDSHFLLANIFINNNFFKSYKLFSEVFPNRKIIMVCNENADVTKLNFKPYIIIRVPEKNSWNEYKNLKEGYKICKDGDVVLFCCGPLGRVLCYEWFKSKPSITCLELGSFYDPWTLNKCYMYHTAILPDCFSCNNIDSKNIDEKLIEEIINISNYPERYFWNDTSIENISQIYKGDMNTVKRYYKVTLKNIGYEEYNRYYYEWMISKIEIESLENKNQDFINKSIYYFINKYPSRAEAPYYLLRYITDVNNKIEILNILAKIKKPSVEESYIDINLYTWKILDNLVIDYYYQQNYEQSYNCWKTLMSRIDDIPENFKEHCIDNGRYAKFMLESKS